MAEYIQCIEFVPWTDLYHRPPFLRVELRHHCLVQQTGYRRHVVVLEAELDCILLVYQADCRYRPKLCLVQDFQCPLVV